MVFFAFKLLNDIAYILYRFYFLKTPTKNTQLPYMVIACCFHYPIAYCNRKFFLIKCDQIAQKYVRRRKLEEKWVINQRVLIN